MIEISQTEIDLMDKRDKLVSYLLVGLLGLYVLGVVLVSAIMINSHQDEIIKNQQETIIYLTSELLKKESIITEIQSDNRMLEELGK